MSGRTFDAADELMHPADPGDRSWNESWYFSWIDDAGGPAGFFRLGVMPNQRRAMLWCFVHVDDEWLAIEETRLDSADLDLRSGVGYDRAGLRFSWDPGPPLRGAKFIAAGSFRVRSGARAGRLVPVAIELSCTASIAPVGTGTGGHGSQDAPFPASRFEQSLQVSGTVVVAGTRHPITAGGHRDRSWGPREWRQPFVLGDVQAPGRQLYFVGRSPGLGTAFLRDGSTPPRHLFWSGGDMEFDDENATVSTARLELTGSDGEQLAVELTPVGTSVCFDMAHTCEPPEDWLYWRALVQARVPAWGVTARGWLEASRYGTS